MIENRGPAFEPERPVQWESTPGADNAVFTPDLAIAWSLNDRKI